MGVDDDPVALHLNGVGSRFLMHAPGATRPMTPWHLAPVCRSKGDDIISFMVTHAEPERRERPTGRTGLDGHGGQPAADLPVPGCGTQSKSRHSAYSRTLRDLSAQGAPVIISARLARWRCRNRRCDRRIFTERLPGLRRRSRARPPAWRVSFGCLAIAPAGGPRSG